MSRYTAVSLAEFLAVVFLLAWAIWGDDEQKNAEEAKAARQAAAAQVAYPNGQRVGKAGTK